MEVKDLAWNETLSKRFNNYLFPISIRGLIVGISGSAKTTLDLNILLRRGWLDYNNKYVFGKSMFQPEYRILEKAFEEQLTKEAIVRLMDNQNEIMNLNLSPINLLEKMAKTKLTDPIWNASSLNQPAMYQTQRPESGTEETDGL